MKKTTIKISIDTVWALNRMCADFTEERKRKVTQDEALRILIENYKQYLKK